MCPLQTWLPLNFHSKSVFKKHHKNTELITTQQKKGERKFKTRAQEKKKQQKCTHTHTPIRPRRFQMIPLEWAVEGHLNVCSWDVQSDRIKIVSVVVQKLGLEMTTSRSSTTQRDASLTEQVPHTQLLTKQDSVCLWVCVCKPVTLCVSEGLDHCSIH